MEMEKALFTYDVVDGAQLEIRPRSSGYAVTIAVLSDENNFVVAFQHDAVGAAGVVRMCNVTGSVQLTLVSDAVSFLESEAASKGADVTDFELFFPAEGLYLSPEEELVGGGRCVAP